MKRWLSILCVLGCAAGLFAADEKKTDVTAQATQLMVRKPLPPKKKEPNPFPDTGSTSLDVTLTAPGKFVLGIDVKASKLGEFTDDKETKLYTADRFGISWLSDLPLINPEGDVCTVHVNGQAPPAKGAAKLHIKGTVVLTCGKDEKSADKKEIAIKKDSKVTVGDFTIQVDDDGAMFGGPRLSVTSEKQNLKGVEFFDAKGEAIKLFFPPYRQSFFQPGGKVRYGLSATLPKKADSVTVKVSYFDKTEAVSVPIDLEFGVGLD
ncbi:MAG TPA: hypothetical protein VFW33_05685 [Gemmataceae bacterium]|nr:hypothetical protein [Gemmataceae bacterium]